MKLNFVFFILLFFNSYISQAQNVPGLKSKVNLEDVKIKGQSNRDGGAFSKKDKHDLFSRVKIRRDFRAEVLKNLPTNYEILPLKMKN